MNNLETLREHLFSTLKGLKDGTIDTEKAKVISDVSQTIINSAKIEVDYIRANGGGSSTFLTNEVKQVKQTATGQLTVNGTSTVHKLR
jgi:gas vesicle protein